MASHPNLSLTEDQLTRLRDKLAAQYKGIQQVPTYHVKFTHSKNVFRYPPESFFKKLKRFFGIKSKGKPFVKLENEP